MKFVNREQELSLLQGIYNKKDAQFIVLYGRRRIGKTSLILHWLEQYVKKDYVYWVAYKTSPGILLNKFSQAIKNLFDMKEDFAFNDWEAAFKTVFDIAGKKKIVLVIDEFPYLLNSVPEISSLLQMVWDQRSRNSHIILIVSGSHYHMMHEEFVSGKAPLYGRSTVDIFLEEMRMDGIRLFLSGYSDNQIVETYSIIGGIPKYLEMWDSTKPVLINIEDLFFSPVTIFRQEALFLIQDEIAEPRTYLAILEAIGSRMKSPVEIAGITGIAINHVGKYLNTLLNLRLLRRITSVDIKKKDHTRQTKYEIRDLFLRFYFTYMYPNLDMLEQKRTGRLMDIIKTSFSSYVGRTGFEEMARGCIIKLGDQKKLSFVPDYVGRIWNKKTEIDVAAIENKSGNILLGECKWTNKKMPEAELDKLKEKAALLSKINAYNILYALFSKKGFTSGLMKQAKKEGILLFEGANLTRLPG